MIHQESMDIDTLGRGFVPLNSSLSDLVSRSGIKRGLCSVFVRHTSASLIVCENADPDVLGDLERWIGDLVQDGDSRFAHRDEGPDDMSAHIRSVLTQTEISVPIVDGRLALGTWQGVFLYEHRKAAHRRRIVVTVLGDPA